MTRLSTLEEAERIWASAVQHDGPKDRNVDGLTRIIWFAAGLTGAAVFFSSFGLLLTPFLFGWSVEAALLSFVAAQYTAQIFLDLHSYWTKAAAWLWLGKHAARADISAELKSKRHLWHGGEAAEA